MFFKSILFLLYISLICSCTPKETFDLVISNCQLLDVNSGKIQQGVSIGINQGVFKKISTEVIDGKAAEQIDAKGMLITPSFIDAHIHPISEFADDDYDMVPDILPADSIDYFRKKLSDGFLPFGTTTVLMMGHPDTWTDEFLKWSSNPESNHVDVYTCGGALATMDENTYKGHFRLEGPKEAKEKIIEYHTKGIKHLKLYWRLKEPELKAIKQVADSLDMKMFSHSGGFFDPTQLNVQQLLETGIKDFEHVAILPCSVFDNRDWQEVHQAYQANFRGLEGEGDDLSLIYILETFRQIEESKSAELIELIDLLQKKDATISTTIGLVYKTYHDTFFGDAKIQTMSQEQFDRCEYNFNLIMDYVKLIHEKDIPIRIGSDTNPGGQIVLSEMMLMNQFGISMEDSFKIASINGAEALGIDEVVGSIELEKQANFIIWNNNPFEDRNNLTKGMQVFKNGIKYK